MATRASIAGHPIHPMLVTLPIGLWVFSLISDIIGMATARPDWFEIAYITLIGGLIGALIAAVPGMMDFGEVRSRHGRRAHRAVIVHLVLNILVTVLVAANIYLRTISDQLELPIMMSFVSVILLAISAWFGGELVHVLGVSLRKAGPDTSRTVDETLPPPTGDDPAGRM